MEMSQIFLWSFKFIHEWGKKIPTLVKQLFVTSNFPTKLFIPRKAAFCWYLWMEDFQLFVI